MAAPCYSAKNPDCDGDVVLESGCLQQASAAIVGKDLLIDHAASRSVQPLNLELASGERHPQGNLTSFETSFCVLVVAVESRSHIDQAIPCFLNQGPDADAGRQVRFDAVIVTHTVRNVADLNYRELFEQELKSDEILGELIGDKLTYYPTVTREDFKTKGRITDRITSGKIFEDLGVPALDPAVDRLMMCGGPSVLADLKQILLDRGFEEGSIAKPGDFVLEKAFVET